MKRIQKVSISWSVSSKELEVIKRYLVGEIGTREAGKLLGCSHQHIINVVSSLAQQWYREGKLKI